MVYEIQKNFLLPDTTLLKNLQEDGILFKIHELEIFYTKITYSQNVKFKSLDGFYYKIIETNDKILEQNQEEQISKKEFEKARKKSIGKGIKKKRYEFKFCSLKSFIEVYNKSKICILKIFFPTLDEANRFILPYEFKIQKEFDYILDSKFITLYGCDFEQINIEKYFKSIEKNQVFDLKFSGLINAFEGYRIFLFYLFKKLKFYWNLALDKKKEEYFYQFISYADKINIILSDTKEIFDKNLNTNLSLRFQEIVEKSNIFFQNDKNIEALLLFLSSENLQSLFSDFDFFIKENSFYEGSQKDKLFKQILADEFRKKLIFFKKNLLKNFENEKFSRSFSGLLIFLEYFCNFFDIKPLNKLNEKFFLFKDREKAIVKIIKKREKFFKLISRINRELKIYKGY